MPGGENSPCFVVTSLSLLPQAGARDLYHTLYYARGEKENRIKECQFDLLDDASQPASFVVCPVAPTAYALPCALRRIGLAHAQLVRADGRQRGTAPN